MPKIGWRIRFGRPNPSGRALLTTPRASLNSALLVKTHRRPHFRTSLSISLDLFSKIPPYIFSINFLPLKSVLLPSPCLYLKSPKFFFETLIDSICLYSQRSTISLVAPRAGSKRKGKELMREESPPHFNHSRYPSLKAFKRYSTRTITFGRVVSFSRLDFICFNQLIRRMGWLTFARLSDPSYPNLIRHFYANLIRPNKHRLDMFTTFGDKVINLDLPTMCRFLAVNNKGDEVFDSNS